MRGIRGTPPDRLASHTTRETRKNGLVAPRRRASRFDTSPRIPPPPFPGEAAPLALDAAAAARALARLDAQLAGMARTFHGVG